MFTSRRARKHSPDPEDHLGAAESPDGNEGAPVVGATSPIPPQRRRTRRDHGQATPSPSLKRTTKSLPLYHTPGGSSTCSNFLLGGHYYPGKDKKVRHYRTRTLWYRVFCSSTWRRMVSIITVAYFALWHVLVPGFGLLLNYGNVLAGKPATTDSRIGGLNLPPIEVEREQLNKFKRLKDSIAGDSRLKLMEKIVPGFYQKFYPKTPKTKTRLKDTTTSEAAGRGQLPDDKLNDDEDEHAQARHDLPRKRREIPSTSDAKPRAPDIPSKPQVTEEKNRGVKPEVKQDNETKSPPEAIMDEKPAPDAKPKDGKRPGESNKMEEPVDPIDRSHHGLPPGTSEDDGTPIKRTILTMDDIHIHSRCPSTLNSVNTTLVIQCSLDRLWILHETCQRWHDPIIAVVQVMNETDAVNSGFETSCSQMVIVPFVKDLKEKEWSYPVNRMRNIGLDMVETSHVLTIDVDFVPSQDLDLAIRSVLMERQAQRMAKVSSIPLAYRDAIVVPAFERIQEDCTSGDVECSHFLLQNSSYMPRTKIDLKKCVMASNCTVFQMRNNWEGHWSTHSSDWLKGDVYEKDRVLLADNTTSQVIKRVRCFDSLRYEPYVVIQWCDGSSKPVAPYYDERFYGYGKNKIQLVSHLRFLGYQFSILPDGFVVHNPHKESNAKQIWNNVTDYKMHESMDRLYQRYIQELVEKYQNVTDVRAIVKECERSEKKSKTKSAQSQY